MENKITDAIIEDMCKDTILTTLQDVKNGNADEETIRYFIGEAAYKIIQSNIEPEELKVTLAQALSQISFGEDANRALGLEKGSRRNDPGLERTMALRVWILINRDGYLVREAIELSSKLFCKSEETIKKIYYRYKTELEKKFQELINH